VTSDPLRRVTTLATFVSETLGGHDVKRLSELKVPAPRTRIPLGFFIKQKAGVCRHRAILFKYLCDHMVLHPGKWLPDGAAAAAAPVLVAPSALGIEDAKTSPISIVIPSASAAVSGVPTASAAAVGVSSASVAVIGIPSANAAASTIPSATASGVSAVSSASVSAVEEPPTLHIHCRLIRGQVRGASHAWNVVQIGSKHYVVDVMQHPDKLLEEDSKEAADYQRMTIDLDKAKVVSVFAL
jgi:hypothetical protein